MWPASAAIRPRQGRGHAPARPRTRSCLRAPDSRRARGSRVRLATGNRALPALRARSSSRSSPAAAARAGSRTRGSRPPGRFGCARPAGRCAPRVRPVADGRVAADSARGSRPGRRSWPAPELGLPDHAPQTPLGRRRRQVENRARDARDRDPVEEPDLRFRQDCTVDGEPGPVLAVLGRGDVNWMRGRVDDSPQVGGREVAGASNRTCPPADPPGRSSPPRERDRRMGRRRGRPRRRQGESAVGGDARRGSRSRVNSFAARAVAAGPRSRAVATRGRRSPRHRWIPARTWV